VIAVVLSGVTVAIAVLSMFARALIPVQDGLLSLIAQVGSNDTQWIWHLVVSAATIAVAVVLARRGQRTGALFLAILGLLDLKNRLSTAGRPLEMLTAAGPGNRADIWWVLIFAGLASWCWPGGSLRRAGRARWPS